MVKVKIITYVTIKKYKHVGLKQNKLKNADIYPYVPCCFKLDQKKKEKFINYYEGKEIVKTEKKQNNIISTDKILKYNQFGTLPTNIEKFIYNHRSRSEF